jgi:hypothetical protein
VDFVQNVTDHPSTFTNFPVETEKGPQPASTHLLSTPSQALPYPHAAVNVRLPPGLVHEGVYNLSNKQARHVTAMLALGILLHHSTLVT